MRAAIASGDEAFGVTTRVRVSIASIFFVAYGAASLVLFGYPRATTFMEWFRGAGAGIFLTCAVFALGALWVTFRANARGAIALVTAATGTLGAATGFAVVFRALATFPPESAFTLFHEGAWEAQANRYVGFTLASSLLYGAEVRRTIPAGHEEARSFDGHARDRVCRSHARFSVRCDRDRGALVRFVLPHTIATLGGLVFAALAAIVRAQALCDAAWTLEPTRAARALALTSAFHERTITFVASTLAVTIAIVIRAALAQAPYSRVDDARVARLAILLALADGALTVRTALAKDAIYTHLEAEFALFSKLDPIVASDVVKAQAVPPIRPTLKIARDRVALDETPAIVLSALDTDAGLAVLRSDLAHRVARDGAESASVVDLLLMVDASTPPHVVLSVFARCVRRRGAARGCARASR